MPAWAAKASASWPVWSQIAGKSGMVLGISGITGQNVRLRGLRDRSSRMSSGNVDSFWLKYRARNPVFSRWRSQVAHRVDPLRMVHGASGALAPRRGACGQARCGSVSGTRIGEDW